MLTRLKIICVWIDKRHCISELRMKNEHSSPDDPFDRRELELEKPYKITFNNYL